MSTQVVFTGTAKNDLREIAVHLAKRSGSRELAVRFVRELQEQTAYETGRVLELLREAGFEECAAYSFLTREAASEQDERVQFAAKKI